MNKLLLASAIALLGSAVNFGVEAQSTTKLSATKANDYGIVYSLPRTVIDVTLQAECTVSTPGEFYPYASRYLGDAAAAKAVKEASTSWQLTGAEVTSRGVGQTSASADNSYLLQLKAGATAALWVNEQGLPLALGTDAAPAVAAGSASKLSAQPLSASPLDSEAARYAVTEDMLKSSSLAKRAELAADQIMQLRQSRQDYLTGQADVMPDGAALQLILKNINDQEEALTAMFLGTVQTRTDVTRVTYDPSSDVSTRSVIARLNSMTGFVDADDLSGAPIYLNFNVTDLGSMPVNDKGEEKKLPKGGVAYCIPGSADVSISTSANGTLCSGSFSVAQLGVVYGLDPALFTDKKAPVYLIFDPTTGGVRELGTLKLSE
jgi:hypothetical protein